MIKIQNVNDAAYKRFGKVITDIELGDLLQAMEATPCPDDVVYVASEAALELGNDDKALEYINDVRERAGLNDLESMTLLDIEQERRVEFALENHRWWDLKRWRRSHIIWDGVSESARHWALFPYKVKDPRRPENGKWVFIRVKSNDMPNYRTFKMQNYYNFLDNSWLTNNPKLIRNPYQ